MTSIKSKPGIYSGEYKTEILHIKLTPTAKARVQQIALERKLSIADLIEKLLRGEITLNQPVAAGESLAS